MAWVFALSAECGAHREGAVTFAAHFEHQVLTRSDGTVHALDCYVSPGVDEGYWCRVAPQGVSRTGVNTKTDQREMDELALLLLEQLKTAPSFRYAIVAVEGDEFRSFSELDQDLVERNYSGVIVSEAIWRSLGSPAIFVAFAPGYRWRPFQSVDRAIATESGSVVRITLTRDSVCAGDDADAPHEKATEMELIPDLVGFVQATAAGYLPAVAGAGHAWTCVLNGVSVAVIETTGIRTLVPEVLLAIDNRVHFVYHAAPLV